MAAGRPTKMTPETIAKLEDAYSRDFTDTEACLFAGIDKSTLYRYQIENPEFCDRKTMLKSNVGMLAKNNVYDQISGGDKGLSVWYLERKQGEDYGETVNLNATVKFVG